MFCLGFLAFRRPTVCCCQHTLPQRNEKSEFLGSRLAVYIFHFPLHKTTTSPLFWAQFVRCLLADRSWSGSGAARHYQVWIDLPFTCFYILNTLYYLLGYFIVVKYVPLEYSVSTSVSCTDLSFLYLIWLVVRENLGCVNGKFWYLGGQVYLGCLLEDCLWVHLFRTWEASRVCIFATYREWGSLFLINCVHLRNLLAFGQK